MRLPVIWEFLTEHAMFSAITTPPLEPSGGDTAKTFHYFPELPAELRIRIWRMAYDAIPNTFVYRFRLAFSSFPDSELSDEEEEAELPQAFLVPLDEVKDLTRGLRSLRRANRESRYEGESLFNGSLRLNQTEQGDTTDLFPPINLPWKPNQNFFCFVDLDEFDLACLDNASTKLIAQVFSTVRLLGFGVDRAYKRGIETFDYSEFAQFILQFPEVHHVSLVSDRLMSKADLDNVDNDLRSTFTLLCWDDWVGRVQEDVIGSNCDQPNIVTKEEHLDALQIFTDFVLHFGDIEFNSAGRLWDIDYGMIFRTKEDFDCLLLDDEAMALEALLGEEMSTDGSSNETPSLLSEGSEDA